MAIVPQLIDLFARLATRLEATSPSRRDAIEDDEDEAQQGSQLSVFSLNRSLNLDDDSSFRVLNKALAMMCFKAPQILDEMVKYYLETITGVLSFSIGCKVLRLQKNDFLTVGSCISRRDCVGLIENFSDVLARLEKHGSQHECLSKAILSVLISSPSCRNIMPSRPILDPRSTDARSTTVSKFLGSLPNGLSFGDSEIPFRLQSWFLDPLTLKHDISNILRESTKRPFLCLYREFHERTDWRSIAKCLALSPTMFIETRALLHRWFMLTGLAPVLDLLIGICSVMLDVILRPSSWDLSMDLGAKLPFSSAYFPHQHPLFRILSGPFSPVSFLHLLHLIDKSSSPCNGTHNDPFMKSSSAKSEGMDHKSAWALAISFPCWFCFASILLFSEKSVPEASNVVETNDKVPSSDAAARYIAWIMNPSDKSEQDSLADHLVKISKSLASKQFDAGTHGKKKPRNRKIPVKPKHREIENNIFPEKYDCRFIPLWLEEFKSFGDQSKLKNALFRRIPLGLLFGCLGNLDRDASELFLHYATSQKIVQFTKADSRSLKRMKRDSKGQRDIVSLIKDYSSEEALMGARLVFSLTDDAENLSTSFSDTDEAGEDFVFHVKMKVSNFLMNCLNRLIELKVDDGNLFAMDLCQKLKQWKHQGQEILEIDKDVDDIIAVLSDKLSSI